MVTVCYKGLQGLHGVTGEYLGLEGVKGGYKGLQKVRGGFLGYPEF